MRPSPHGMDLLAEEGKQKIIKQMNGKVISSHKKCYQKKIKYNKMVALKGIGSKDPSDRVVGKGILKR